MTGSINRQTARDALASLLNIHLVGAGKIAEVLYGYKVGKVEASPTIVISSSSSQRALAALDGTAKYKTVFVFDVTAFVKDATETNPDYTEQDVENLLDLIDKEIADVIGRNTVFSIDGIGDVFMEITEDPSEINEDPQRGMVLETRMVSITIKESE
jgi:hypothetical protein